MVEEDASGLILVRGGYGSLCSSFNILLFRVLEMKLPKQFLWAIRVFW